MKWEGMKWEGMKWEGTFTQYMIAFTLMLFCLFFYSSIIKNFNKIWKQNFSRNTKGEKEGFMDYADPQFKINVYGATTNSTSYLANMKAYKNNLTDMFGISTPKGESYRKNYEDTITTLEDILGLMALQITLSIDVGAMSQQDIVTQMTKIGELIEAQVILNKFIYPIIDKM